MLSVFVGFDPREAAAYAVAKHTARSRMISPIKIRGLVLNDLRARGLYTRQTVHDDAGRLWDTISGAPMSTEFAISRFLVPHIARQILPSNMRRRGWALFMDCDVLIRTNVEAMIKGLDEDKALYCVQHNFEPPEGIKMGDQIQTRYARKNWSSVMLFNLDHKANEALTPALVNELPGRDLHRFCWLGDDEIGALDPKWNWLVGHSSPEIEPAIVHFTDGLPFMKGYESVPFADEWREALDRWAI